MAEQSRRSSAYIQTRFHDIAWSQPVGSRSGGVIAGALERGSLDLWDAERLRSGAEDAFMSRTSNHKGDIKALQFNPFRHELLATAGFKGELYITDVNNTSTAFRVGTNAADDFESVDWNKKVPHILATGSSGGLVTVWDIKGKKESMTLNKFKRKAVSAVVWDPDVNTRLVTATLDDQEPLIQVWDLRNANTPERSLKAHDQGVLSLSWCPQDSDLLLSCGKDNRTICWNPRTGEALGEFPVVTNWTFQTRWNPHIPSLLATASFDGKIAVQTIQNTNPSSDHSTAAGNESLDGEEFFAKAQTQPQGAAFSLQKAPKWLERPVSVSFGFGGKLVKVGPAGDASRSSKISISTFAVDPSIHQTTKQFEEALQKGEFVDICESKIAEAKTEEEKADWRVIETLASGNSRKQLIEYLGLSDDKLGSEDTDAKDTSTQPNGTTKTKDDASFFDDADAGDSFLSNLAATKGARTNNPFQMYTGNESDADRSITRALTLGSFEKALDICLKEDRLSDAFMIAICGGQKCIDKAQAAYFKRKSGGPNYLRLLAAVVGKNLWDVVHNADLENWKEVMATICTFADAEEFPDLCEALGDRLEESIQESSDSGSLRKDASFCYLAGSKLEKVVVNWAQELEESERAGLKQEESDTSFSVHARSLQTFIEKVSVFRQVAKFEDTELQQTSDWKMAPLYAKYTEYADILASHGQFEIAEKYLDLLPASYPAAEVARNRVKQATRKAAPQAAQKQTAAPAAAAQRGQRVVPAYQPTQAPSAPAQASAPSPYAPLGGATSVPQMPQNTSYAPAGASAYTPAGYQPLQPTFGQSKAGIPTPSPYGLGYQPPQAQPIPPPPRGFTDSPSGPPPPPKAGNLSNWNDTPEFGSKPPTSRRGTPAMGAAAITSPFPNQSNMMSPPPPGGSPYSAQHVAQPTLPPPPKGPPRVSSPPTGYSPQSLQLERPSSSAANVYAPPQPSQQLSSPTIPPPIMRGPSPYNPPPSAASSAAPPSNRYAPAPGTQPTPTQFGGPPSGGFPPRQVAPPPPNPYASQLPNAYGQPAASPYSSIPPPTQPPPPAQAAPPQGPPRAAPPQGPSQGPPRVAAQAPPQQRAAAAPAPEPRPGTAQSQRSATATQKHRT